MEKKLEEDFHFYKKKAKAKTTFITIYDFVL